MIVTTWGRGSAAGILEEARDAATAKNSLVTITNGAEAQTQVWPWGPRRVADSVPRAHIPGQWTGNEQITNKLSVTEKNKVGQEETV